MKGDGGRVVLDWDWKESIFSRVSSLPLPFILLDKMRHHVECPDIVIGNGGTTSNSVRSYLVHGHASDILLIPDVVDGTKTYLIEINEKEDGTGDWKVFSDGTTDISAPITKAQIYPFLSYTFRIVASGAVVGQCNWKMKMSEDV